MSVQEFKLRKLLEDATFFINNAEEDETYLEKCKECMDQGDTIIRQNTRDSYLELSPEVIVMFAEVALLTNKRDADAQRILDIFFQRITQEDQFFCRALLAYATVEERKVKQQGLKGDDNLKQVLHAYTYVKRAIDIAIRPENKLKYQFIVYNASIKTWHLIRSLMKPGWSKNLVEIIERISNLLEEADDSDFNWRCRYLNALVKAMFDAEKKPEALKILDKLNDLTKKKGECKFQETLFRNRLHLYRDNNGVLGAIKKETETGQDPNAFKSLYTIQSIKSGIIPDAQIEKELIAIMSALSPQSISNDAASAQASTKITPLFQDRLAECGRIAIKYNLIQLCEGACNIVSRARQGSLRAKVWTEYSKSELLIKKPSSDLDSKTGMKLNTLQKQIEDFERRIEALKILDRAMIANKRLQDADIIIEGCILIWNIGIPLLKQSTRHHIYKPFQSAATALESIQSNDNVLRVCFHLELAKYEIEQDFLSKASLQLKKALDIDYSITLKQMAVDIKEDDDPSDFQRPYQKILKFLLKKLSLKTNIYGGEPETMHDQLILNVENAKTTKNQKMRETLLGQALQGLQEFEEPEFYVDESLNLVEEEIKGAQKKFHLQNVRERKERVLIAAEIARLANEQNIVDLAFEAATLAVSSEWDVQKNTDLIIAQSSSHIIIAGCYVEYLLEEDIEIGYKDLVTIDEDQDERDINADDKAKYHGWKQKFAFHIISGVKLGQQAQQSWLIFNGSIELWNNYLPLFKKHNFYELILTEGIPAIVECFEAMNNCFINASFSPDNVDYELDKKMQVFSNLSIMLARIYEQIGKNEDTIRVCDILLQKQLPSHLRKTFDSIKARVTKQVSNIGAPGKGGAPAKGAKDAPPVTNFQPSKTDIITSEVLSYLELIINGNKDMINKAMETLNMWSPNNHEEIELEMNVELWCRLGRLATNLNTYTFTKISLYCAEMALKNGDDKVKNKQYMQIPVTRLRWYAVAESLYGESLFKLLDTQKQEKESQDQLLHTAVSHFVESCNISAKASIGYLVLESAKLMWNALLPLLDQPNNRKLLVKPLTLVHGHLKSVQENNDADFLVLLYSALFTCVAEQKEWKLGETIVEEAFTFMPPTHQKVLWEAKMLFLSKLGKNVLSAISNMKESNASLMAKVWVKLARSSTNELEQHSAYNKAIEILRKEESVEVVEVLIEYAEWLHRHKYSSQDVEDQLLLAVDLLMDIEPGWDDEDEEGIEGEGQDDEAKTRKTGKSKMSRMSKQSQAKTAKKSMASKSNMKSKVGGQSKKSKANKRSAALKSKAGSRHSRKTTTALSKRQEEDSQPPFLNCSHFEKLVRIHSMLANIAPDSFKQKEYTLDAHFFAMKLWEQSFQTLNAIAFYEEHKSDVEELGFSQGDVESRRQYFAEIFTNSEIQIPVKYNLPEKAEDWVNFNLPDAFLQKCNGHEDKIMIAKWTFVKPELTYTHLLNVLQLLEEHYFTIQMTPLIELLKLFSKVVLDDKKLDEIMNLRKARLLLNLGLKQEGENIKNLWDNDNYKLTDEEKKVNIEKIKALKDTNDNLKDKFVDFNYEDEYEPVVLESFRIHEVWIQYAHELLKWGEFIKAKDLIIEANLHARILKDQNNYSQSLLMLSTIAFLEGESASALRCDMLCHQYAKEMKLVEQSIEHTFDLLLHYNKIDDCLELINPALVMLHNLLDKQNKKATQTNTQQATKYVSQNNLPLDYALETVYLLKAILSLKESQALKTIDEKCRKMEESFSYIQQYENFVQRSGFKQSHLIKLLKYAKYLQEDFNQALNGDIKSVEFLKSKLERNAKILLRVQELVTNQVYYIGLHQDSNQSKISLPIVRLLGITKLRIAQTNTAIGIVKNSIKLSSNTSLDPEKRLDKIVATFMDAVTKQIEAQTNTYKLKMNRYEKSISILYSALNMIHPLCTEYAEVMVEIAKCRRLLAVNKKHLRGQWRQDAIEVDQINLKKIQQDEEQDRKDQLEEKGLSGEVADVFIDYKEEALRTFIDLLEVKGDSLEKSTFHRILERIGQSPLDNILGTFSLEYAECRGNLNKEQSFFYLALYQYSVSRQNLLSIYLNASTEKHPDILRLRHLQHINNEFNYFSSPFGPKIYTKSEEELKDQSKPFKIINAFAPVEEMKENLPHSSAYVVIQLSEDKQQLYYGILQITKDRKFNYNVSKITLSDLMRNKLFEMVENLGQSKIAMQKTPITIEEDLENLENDAEHDITQLMNDLEAFFDPISQLLNSIINPVLQNQEEEAQTNTVQGTKPGGAQPPKKDDKKAPPPKQAPKAAAAKGGELAQYESNLPLPTSGIESLILLIDQRIESLPIETLQVFSKVPVVARDFNLHMYMNRLKNIGHQAPIHNNQGINKESLRYIIDPPQPLEEKSQKFVTGELPKLLPNSKWDGILSKSQHIPSEGEWQRQISNASLFTYYSMTCLLHKFPSALISDLSIFSKCRAMVILDRMNSFKTLVDRNVLTSKHFVANEQPYQQVVLFSLCGVSTIVTNHWSIKPETNYEMLEQFMKSALTEQIYLGAALRKYKEDKEVINSNGEKVIQKKKAIFKYNPITYGVPIIRIV